VVHTVKGKKQTAQRCTTKLVSGSFRFTTGAKLKAATLSRGGVVYATGEGRHTVKTSILLLRPLRKLKAGRYKLKLGLSRYEAVVLR
jgi:hypothetical protein